MTPAGRAQLAKAAAMDAGFDRVGITSAAALGQSHNYNYWLRAGYAGSMDYLRRQAAAKENPAEVLPGARSVICLALNYRREDPSPSPENRTAIGKVARYARGMDYHVVMQRKLWRFIDFLRDRLGEDFAARPFVDSGPLLERQLAARAGLGWIGKNTLLLHPRHGSYSFLAEVVTTLELADDTPETDHCGTCTRCLDACPTQALIAPYQMDASHCISYLTIEYRADIPPTLARAMGDWVYGCDICQEVCPFNRKAPLGTDPDLGATRVPAYLDVTQLIQLTSGDYRRLTRETAARRAHRKMWQRNAAIVQSNAAAASTKKAADPSAT